ncbi:hypothetical protein A5761_15035 [Mycolicibacterium setense]|uniref:hypothetical protein n=1 Tax=Mycolicibacterium setense TaxID=431269 RepID=UPI0007EB8309|nr:hypothetical protein [Mycolicibacterium setense]OBB15054.1 hypothetical protein A5761_15035 [Mycolicibacterium setense]
MKVRMKQRPTGYVSLGGEPPREWPKVGSVVDLPPVVAEDLIAAGRAEKVIVAKVTEEVAPKAIEEVEKRPAPTDGQEQRNRPAPKKGTGG